MTSPIVNVARYSALAGGITYGVFHRRTLQAREDKKADELAKKRLAHAIEDQKKKADAEALARLRGGPSNAVVADPDSPNFDLEKFLLSLEKTSQ